MAANRFIVFSAFLMLMTVFIIGVDAEPEPFPDPEPEPFADPEPVAHPDPLIPIIRCTIQSNVYNPVCGSNGSIYRNIYYLRCDILRKPGLKLRHYGVCRV
ncbi:hypothetical protein CHUAL_006353 [Chamberlinius hualienensis]